MKGGAARYVCEPSPGGWGWACMVYVAGLKVPGGWVYACFGETRVAALERAQSWYAEYLRERAISRAVPEPDPEDVPDRMPRPPKSARRA